MIDRPKGAPKPRSMQFRVGLVAVASAALGGLAAALIAIVTVDRLIAHHADVRLSAATVTLAGELDEDPPARRLARLQRTLDDENEEIVTSGIRLAVFEHQRLLAGDAWMTAPHAGSCETRRVGGGRVRSCAGAYGGWTLVAAQPIDDRGLYGVYALAALAAVLLGAITGGLSSLGLSRWATGPLQALSQKLRASDIQSPAKLDLGPESSCVEVEAVRQALGDLASRLQLLLDQAHRFAADAAHELRTPMAALRAELELVAEEVSARERPALKRACTRVERLSELLERLLVLALPSDDLREGFETISLADIVEETARSLSDEARSRLTLDLESEGLVRGDARLLGALVENALGNALKFDPNGSICVSIEESISNGRVEEIALTVSDEGPGVPLALRERVFEPFYRATPNAARGHGLGLALVGHIAQAHGGKAHFANVARGAELVIELPAWKPERSSSRRCSNL